MASAPVICVSVVSAIERAASRRGCSSLPARRGTTDSSASIAASVWSSMPAVIADAPGRRRILRAIPDVNPARRQRLDDERHRVADAHQHEVGGALPVLAGRDAAGLVQPLRATRATCAA